MSGMPKVAVLMSVYKNDQISWLNQALDSIACQSYGSENIRLYLAVDGQVGNDLEDVLALRKNEIHKLVRNNVNRGLSKTLNLLIDSLEDEVLAFRMDADDVCMPDRFEIQAKFLLENRNIGIVGSGCTEIDENGVALRERTYPEHASEIEKFACKANPMLHPSMCYRCDLFDEGLRYPANYRLSQDWALVFEAIRRGIVLHNIPKSLINWRLSSDFFARRSIERSWQEFIIGMGGIYKIRRISWRYIYPFARLAFRLLPTPVAKFVYGSQLRKSFLK
ncbi:MAG TPA: glycosyl transferase family 2 [Planctomycetaceae bacterium]|nr:glycosyl transferase family 2 [Planctomycetaceae bacterium]